PKDNPIKRFFQAKRDRERFLKAAIDRVLDTEVLDVSLDMARDYVRRANEAINPLPDNAAKETMLELGEYVLGRRS
ncbi:MAG: hypothetical protein KC479_04720, partial [Dehalococcoidia bacterium]|nr:hypothetical protein [Dehalococcoidia bacterium]